MFKMRQFTHLEKHQLILNLVAATGTKGWEGPRLHFISSSSCLEGESGLDLSSSGKRSCCRGLCLCRACRKCVEGNTWRSSLQLHFLIMFTESFSLWRGSTGHIQWRARQDDVFNYAHTFLQFPGIVSGYILFSLFSCGSPPTLSEKCCCHHIQCIHLKSASLWTFPVCINICPVYKKLDDWASRYFMV